MKSPLQLIVAGVAFAIIAWAFWHYFADYAVQALILITLVSLAIDNHRLRRQLKSSRQ